MAAAARGAAGRACAGAPISAASATIGPSRLLHCRAATPGATIIALISTTPTACKPTTMAMTMSGLVSVSVMGMATL